MEQEQVSAMTVPSNVIIKGTPGVFWAPSHETRWRRGLFLGCLLLTLAAGAHAGDMAENYARAEQFLSWNYSKLAFSLRVEPHWLGKSERFWYRNETPGGSEFWLVDPQHHTRKPAFDRARLAAALSRVAGKDYAVNKLPFEAFEYLNHERALAFPMGGKQWTCDLKSYQCTQVALPFAEDELPSPDGRWVAFLRDHNLFVRSTASHEEIQLTTDGRADFDYGSHAGANLSYVSDQISHEKFPPVVLWSHDSKRILTELLDQRQVGLQYLLQSVPPDGSVRPILWPFRLPLPGEAVPTVQIVIFDIATRSRVTVEGDPLLALYTTPLELNQIQWSDDDTRVYIVDLQRGLHSWILRGADPRTGITRTIIEERNPTFVPTADGEHLFADGIRFIDNGAGLVSYSERDGWGHLYLYDAKTGMLNHQITHGAWLVRALLWVDERDRKVYFTAGGREPGRDPYFRHLYRINLDGSNIELLSPEDADHEIFVSPGGHYFVDNYSRVDLPPTSVLRSADGRVILTLEKADISRLITAGWKPPERFSAKAADGTTDLYGVIFRPSGFDASNSYPVIDCIYPGPQSIRTPKSFMDSSQPAIGEPESLAELGFVTVTVDGRGTPFRSKPFHDVSYGHMGQAGNLEDHIAVIRQLAKRYPYMDLNRVGIIGHSAGGYAAARAILSYPDFYKVAVSGAGLHDLRGYNADWGEIYQGLPNGSNYSNTANKDLAANLKGKLLLIIGDMDDNVPPALTFQLIDALIKANKDFDLLVLPNRNHTSAYLDPYATRHRWDYFVKNLLGVEPPAGYVIKPPPGDLSR